jgi:hypothetical protein
MTVSTLFMKHPRASILVVRLQRSGTLRGKLHPIGTLLGHDLVSVARTIGISISGFSCIWYDTPVSTWNALASSQQPKQCSKQQHGKDYAKCFTYGYQLPTYSSPGSLMTPGALVTHRSLPSMKQVLPSLLLLRLTSQGDLVRTMSNTVDAAIRIDSYTLQRLRMLPTPWTFIQQNFSSP